MERTAKLCHCQGECCNVLHSHQPGRGGCFFASLPAFGVAAFFFFLMLAILIGVYYYLIVVLICVYLLGNNIEYISFYFETSLFPKLFQILYESRTSREENQQDMSHTIHLHIHTYGVQELNHSSSLNRVLCLSFLSPFY